MTKKTPPAKVVPIKRASKTPPPAAKKAPAKKKPGRVSRVSSVGTIEELCSMVREGKMLSEVAGKWGIPLRTLTDWIAADSTRSAHAREARACSAVVFEEMAQAGIEQAADPFELAKAKERAHHLRWKASKINPKDYGDKVQVDANLNVNDMTDAELERRLAAFGVAVVSPKGPE